MWVFGPLLIRTSSTRLTSFTTTFTFSTSVAIDPPREEEAAEPEGRLGYPTPGLKTSTNVNALTGATWAVMRQTHVYQ